jgi:hypothetical protein
MGEATAALTVATEVDHRALWEAFEPRARQAGVRAAVIYTIAAGAAPRGLLSKEGIWAPFTMGGLRSQVRDTTWQAVSQLVGESGVVNLAIAVGCYEMMARLNHALDLEQA